MSKKLTELLKNYRNSVERAYAGKLVNKEDKDLSNDDISKAKKDIASITNLSDYYALVNALDGKTNEINGETEMPMDIFKRLQHSYKLKPIKESSYFDKYPLLYEGYGYYVVIEDEKVRNKVTKFLDEENIEYMEGIDGHIQLKFKDRPTAYRVESFINNEINRSNSRFVREKKQIIKSRDPNAVIAKLRSGSGAHSSKKYNKTDRQKGKKDIKGVNNEK